LRRSGQALLFLKSGIDWFCASEYPQKSLAKYSDTMLLRIFLIVSILAGAGVVALTHFKVRPHIQSIIDKRNSETTRADVAEKDAAETHEKLAQTEKTLKKTETELSDTQDRLTAANRKATEQEKRANDLKVTLDSTKKELNSANQVLEQWRQLDVQPDQVRAIVNFNRKLTNEVAMAKVEYAILQKAYIKATNEIARLTGTDEESGPPLPPGLKGTVLVVDPKWDFLVLDIGESKGVVQHGVMMVSRESKLIAKVRIMSVQQDRCIANIMPGWKLGEVMEGDAVIY